MSTGQSDIDSSSAGALPKRTLRCVKLAMKANQDILLVTFRGGVLCLIPHHPQRQLSPLLLEVYVPWLPGILGLSF